MEIREIWQIHNQECVQIHYIWRGDRSQDDGDLESKDSLKVKIFLWMAWHDRIQTAQQLKRRNWDGSKRCKYCGLEESADHLLFQCPAAMVTWCWVRDSLGWPKIPTSIISYQDLGREG